METADIVKDFIQYTDVSQRSRKQYLAAIKPFRLWLARNTLELFKLTRADLIQYKMYLIDTYTSTYTVRSYFTVLQLFFRYLEDNNLYENISVGITKPKKPRDQFTRMPLMADEVLRLKSTIDRSAEIGKRDYLIVSMAIALGLRVGEVSQINIDDIHRGSLHRIKIKGKGWTGKSDFLNIPELYIQLMDEYLAARGPHKKTDPLFISYSPRNRGRRIGTRSLQRMAKKYLKLAGLDAPEYSFHSFRHTTATLLLANKTPLEQIQRHMRHTLPSTTEIYLRWFMAYQHENSTLAHEISAKTDIPIIKGHYGQIMNGTPP